jgi:hypothetical protein
VAQRYSLNMNELVTPFRPKPATASAKPVAQKHTRMTFRIGGRRFAFDFQSTVTELNPFDAPVISIRRKLRSQNGQ